MTPYSNYAEPLRSHMRRRRCAQIATVAITALITTACALAAVTIGSMVLKASLSLAIASPIPGCC